MTDADLEAAWAEVHENTPEGWYVVRPMEHPERDDSAMFASDPSETPVAGKRSGEWTTIGPTELECLQDVAYWMGELKAGRWPK